MEIIPSITIRPNEVGPILVYSFVFGCIIKANMTSHANTTHIIIRSIKDNFPKNSLAKAAINIILEKLDRSLAVNSLNLYRFFSLIAKTVYHLIIIMSIEEVVLCITKLTARPVSGMPGARSGISRRRGRNSRRRD